MPIPVAKLPAALRAVISSGARAAAKLPPLKPPTIDGFTLDPEVWVGIRLHKATGEPALSDLEVAEARRVHAQQIGAYMPRPKRRVERDDFDLDGIPVRRYRSSAECAHGPAIVWYHGGGWVVGSIESDDMLCAWIAEHTGLSVFSVEYRMGPEHRFPAAHEDAVTAWQRLTERAGELEFDPLRTAVSGSSAGGNLSAWVSIGARDRGLVMPAYQLIIYPATELAEHAQSRTTLGEGFLLDTPLLDWFEEQYFDPEDLADPRISVLRTPDLTGLPPAHVVTAGFDPLRDEGRLYADRLERANVPVYYECITSMPHAFVETAGGISAAMPITKRLFSRCADALRSMPPSSEPWQVRARSCPSHFDRPRVCVIGAGASGITASKALWDKGVSFDCIEVSDRIGGTWAFGNPNGMSAAYRSLHINTSRQMMAYRDFEMPSDYPDYPHHSLIADYFESYVDHFGFRGRIEFNTAVEHIEPVTPEVAGQGGWDVEVSDGSVRHYDSVVVCNGHHWSPRLPNPTFPGTFDGLEMHSHGYIDPTDPHDFRGKRVLVVGFGNSAMDIACELSQRGVAEKVVVSTRRGGWVVPHYLLGRPADSFGGKAPRWMPFGLTRAGFELLYRTTVGKVEDFGLPTPDHKIFGAHPTISSEFLPRLGRGDISIKPNIEKLDGSSVHFVDQTSEGFDAIIYCTGYNVEFPFFDRQLLNPEDNRISLFHRVVPADIRNLYFVGLLQPLGAIMPLAEAQSKWIAELVDGDATLPDEATMQRVIDRDRERIEKRYVKAARHTLQVDFKQYLDDLAAARASSLK